MPMDRPGEGGEIENCRYGKKKGKGVCQDGSPRNALFEFNVVLNNVNNGILATRVRIRDGFY